MGRRAVGEGPEHVAEPAFDDVGWNLQNLLENPLLQRGLVDPDRPSPEFHAVQDNVVVLPPHFFRRGLEQRGILGNRRSDGTG